MRSRRGVAFKKPDDLDALIEHIEAHLPAFKIVRDEYGALGVEHITTRPGTYAFKRGVERRGQHVKKERGATGDLRVD